MDLHARKILFVQEFLRLQNEDIIGGLEKLMKKRKAELFEKELQPMSIDQFNEEIDLSVEDSKQDNITDVNTLKNKIDQWS